MRRLLALLIATSAFALGAAPALALPPVKHVFVIVLANKGIEHFGLDNYMVMVSGQPPTPKTKADCPDPLTSVGAASVPPYNLAAGDGCTYPSNFPTIADQLAGAGKTWKGYNEDIPAPCSMAAS